MSLSSDAPFDSATPCSGSTCDPAAVVSLDWQFLSSRFDEGMIEADFGNAIDQDLADLRCRLSQFVSKASSRWEHR